jgi:hypothetical protein
VISALELAVLAAVQLPEPGSQFAGTRQTT